MKNITSLVSRRKALLVAFMLVASLFVGNLMPSTADAATVYARYIGKHNNNGRWTFQFRIYNKTNYRVVTGIKYTVSYYANGNFRKGGSGDKFYMMKNPVWPGKSVKFNWNTRVSRNADVSDIKMHISRYKFREASQ